MTQGSPSGLLDSIREPVREECEALEDYFARRFPEAAVSLNRYPDREFVELRTALAAYLDTSGGTGITPSLEGDHRRRMEQYGTFLPHEIFHVSKATGPIGISHPLTGNE